MELTAKLVRDIVEDCTVTDQAKINQFSSTDAYQERIIDDTILINGITHNQYFFDIDKLKAHEDEIMDALKELPENFMLSSGAGGWSFLNCCMNRSDCQWGEHQDADMLIALGRAIGRVVWLVPEPYWPTLPGGMPYFIVLDGPAPKKPEPRRTNPLITATKNFLGIAELLAFCTVFGLVKLTTLPISLIHKITQKSSRKQAPIEYDIVGDSMKDVMSVAYDIAQHIFGCKASLLASKINPDTKCYGNTIELRRAVNEGFWDSFVNKLAEAIDKDQEAEQETS